MEGRGSSEGFSLPPNIPRGRQRQQRTVYSVEQREELERIFEGNHYPSYEEREALAARLNLQEQQVQVWFKNRRAKYRKAEEPAQQRGRAASVSTQGAGISVPPPPAPGPGPAAAGPGLPNDQAIASGPGFSGGGMAPGGAVFLEDPGFYSPPPQNPFGGFPAAETSASSYTQAWWGPAQDAQNPAPAAPAPVSAQVPAPVPAPAPASAPAAAAAPAEWSEDPYALNFCPDFSECPSLAELLSSQDPLEGPSSLLSRVPEREESEGEDDSGPRIFQDL